MHNNCEICINKKIENACYTILTKYTNNGIYYCSGSFFSVCDSDLKDGLFLTAAHCIKNFEYGLLSQDTNLNDIDPEAIYITNPITKNWELINLENIYYDGIGDIAIIKTGFDLNKCNIKPLKLSNIEPCIGDECYICGNPGGYDTKSFSKGVIRDPNYCEPGGYQVVNSLLITAPGIGGNSGSPILNKNGDIIGIFTFGFNNLETLGGGANLWTLQKSLKKLLNYENNRDKKYLGIHYYILNPFGMKEKYNKDTFNNKGIYINKISDNSPFKDILNEGDLLLSAEFCCVKYNFGILPDQRPLGVLCYEYNVDKIKIKFCSSIDSEIKCEYVFLDKTYNDVDIVYDRPLGTSYNTKIEKKIKLA